MITEKHYTAKGEHPEDRIFRDKEYVLRVQKHVDEICSRLARDLRLSKEGENYLFDYIFNVEADVEFEEYLEDLGLDYDKDMFAPSLIKKPTLG
jgi:hypothetical protein